MVAPEMMNEKEECQDAGLWQRRTECTLVKKNRGANFVKRESGER